MHLISIFVTAILPIAFGIPFSLRETAETPPTSVANPDEGVVSEAKVVLDTDRLIAFRSDDDAALIVRKSLALIEDVETRDAEASPDALLRRMSCHGATLGNAKAKRGLLVAGLSGLLPPTPGSPGSESNSGDGTGDNTAGSSGGSNGVNGVSTSPTSSGLLGGLLGGLLSGLGGGSTGGLAGAVPSLDFPPGASTKT